LDVYIKIVGVGGQVWTLYLVIKVDTTVVGIAVVIMLDMINPGMFVSC
jgi:hypothetical protein